MNKLLYFEFQLPNGKLIIDNTNSRLPELYDNYKLLNMSTNFESFTSMQDAEAVSDIDIILNEEPEQELKLEH